MGSDLSCHQCVAIVFINLRNTTKQYFIMIYVFSFERRRSGGQRVLVSLMMEFVTWHLINRTDSSKAFFSFSPLEKKRTKHISANVSYMGLIEGWAEGEKKWKNCERKIANN